MNFFDILLIAVALSLDAFSVSVSCGMKLHKNNYRKFLKISFMFGLFQAIMPLGGYLLANTFLTVFLGQYANWIGGGVFLLLGLKILYDYFVEQNGKQEFCCYCDGYKCLLTLAVATSIDAFLIGSVLGVKNSSLVLPVILIGAITFVNSLLGCFLGNYSITLLQKKSRLVAAVILIVLAVKTVI